MTDSKNKDSKKEKQDKAGNESTLPLLESEKPAGVETPEKESIEMDQTKDGKVIEESKDGKKKKEKKEKVKKERVSPFVCAQNFTVGLNVIDRDDKRINPHVNLNFDDILAETDSNQGFEFIWRLTFLIFSTTKYWFYRLICAVIALPLALLWAIVFSLINVSVVWITTPAFKVILLLTIHKYAN